MYVCDERRCSRKPISTVEDAQRGHDDSAAVCAARAEHFQWIRADYFRKYLLGDFDQSVDMCELNREKPQDNKTPGAPLQVITTLTTTSTGSKTAEK